MAAADSTMKPSWNSAVYFGAVMHRRLGNLRHSFRYRIFNLLLDLDDLAGLDKRLRLFGYNRPAVLSFYDRDHGLCDGSPVRLWIDGHLRQAGLDHVCGGSVQVLCFPRIWGYVFNPLSVYFCRTASGDLAAILYEVKNTFGQTHGYLLPVARKTAENDAIVEQSCAKNFYVSPFIPLEGNYRFRVRAPGERMMVGIRQNDGKGQALHAILSGIRAPLNDATLARAVLLHPLMTLKVMAAIHWEALRLWIKGAIFYRRPAPPSIPVSYGSPLP